MHKASDNPKIILGLNRPGCVTGAGGALSKIMQKALNSRVGTNIFISPHAPVPLQSVHSACPAHGQMSCILLELCTNKARPKKQNILSEMEN